MDPWDKLGTGATLRRGPPRLFLTKDTAIGKLKPSPEVVEHMIEDLEDRLKHYFNLYVKERKDREIEQEKNLLLQEKMKQLCSELDMKDKKLCELEHNIKELFIHPKNIKDTLDRIDLIYIHLDTLVQAFIGIATCATLNGLNKNIFTKIALEYLHPCRNLDSRLDALYSALYSLLLTSNTNEGFFGQSSAAALEGFYVTISEIVFETNVDICIPNQIYIGLRYDHEEPVKMTSAKVVNGVCAVNLDKHLNLPPKRPGKIPRFVIDIWFESSSDTATASVSVIDPVLLEARAPWALLVNNLKIGTVNVGVNPYPINARMPAERFKMAKEFAHVHKGAKPIIDYHLLQPPSNPLITSGNANYATSDETSMSKKSVNTQLPSGNKEAVPKPIVTVKVESSSNAKPTNRSSSNVKSTNSTNSDKIVNSIPDERDIKNDTTPFVPKKQPPRKPGLGRPLPKRTTPLPKPKPPAIKRIKEDAKNEGDGIIKTILESQPEKVTSIDNSASPKLKEFDPTQPINDGSTQNNVVSTPISEQSSMNANKSDEDTDTCVETTTNADNVEKTEEIPNEKSVVSCESDEYRTNPPKMIVERKLSTKKSDANISQIDTEVSGDRDGIVTKKSLTNIQIKSKKPLPNIKMSNEGETKLDETAPQRKPKLVPLVPLAKPILLIKKAPM
ncbi:hypothetical protein BMR1_03g03025 [Babesia microti strain RI]|uniref:Uncharacterized protein n=1 Tax=Babesia microti (strain RI) TaxID=1133968 RepID=A0A0K3ARW9_BABMR|nr:hypothetical protein BMR1_03g03025 [Babesia microti strain RI]CTQ41205.1 hypothetical protein BMR1_03g03025 [Babesia microti strain RI]|eukprot:XP_012649216.1 hypothetical protein BMR1_03g03025 [Babesia microti strain RI]